MQSKRWKAQSPSGISRPSSIPKVLKHPGFIPIDSAPGIKNVYCYITKHYGNDGLSALIYREQKNDQVSLLFGDWNGGNLDIQGKEETNLTYLANKFIEKDFILLLNVMFSIKIPQAQFFFGIDDDGLVLTDMQLSLNKFAGPGMIQDIFGKVYRTQEIKKIEAIDDRAFEYINMGTGSYEGDLVLKPSRFRMHHDQEANTYQPMYVEVRR